MPRGLAESFVRLTEREERRSIWSFLVLVPVAWIAYFIAELSDAEAYGWNVRIFAGLLTLGFVGGLFVSNRFLHHLNDGLRTMWGHYMQSSKGSAGLVDVDRLAHGKPPSSHIGSAVFVFAALVANALLFALLWNRADLGATVAPYLVAFDGVAIGAYAAWRWLALRWAHAFIETADELAADGVIAVWGER